MGRVVSVVYTFVTPFLNPLIYSMRNKELKDALNKDVKLNPEPQDSDEVIMLSAAELAQMFFFIFLGSADCILLGIMAYDRFVAIRDPLRYTLIMRWQLCAQLSAGALVLGFIQALQLTVLIFHLPFCGHNVITHFYCDVLPVLRLACGDTRTPEAMIFIVSVISLTIPFSLISISYIFIVAAILKIRSAEGRHKAFSTCSSHVTVVLLVAAALSTYAPAPATTWKWAVWCLWSTPLSPLS
ncbi:Olfactory receptor 10V1 [Tupaia chinensis]|uniref:Olfactory receptor 10V1 n=1 Tax=Tupaia chinensis TaxID=246437 RepID=L9KVS2_TUPCH|nr:Olfactory receptor 10V1 [Tupaia chinensis]